MWIYTTVEGDVLRDVAQRMGTTTEELIRLNEPEQTSEQLPPGLHLLVPGPPVLAQPYTMRDRDSLTAMARRLNADPSRLAAWLGVGPGAQQLPFAAGELVYVPKRVMRKRSIEVNAYLLPTGTPSDAHLLDDVTSVTYLSVFSYQVQADGSIEPRRDEEARSEALRQRMAPLLTLTNFDGNRFNAELAHTVLTNSSLRARVVEQAVQTMLQRRFRGVMLDFEGLDPSDRDLYTAFVQELSRRLRAVRGTVAISLPPRERVTSGTEPSAAYDYRALGREADFVEVRTYEWGWVGGPPNPLSPLNRVRPAIADVTRVIPPGKVMLGMTLYGYDWPLPYAAAERASKVSNNTAQNIAISERAPVRWNAVAASPNYRYAGDYGRQREVWFEDALSTAVKLQLIYDFRLRGVSFWVMPNESPQTWYLLKDSFDIARG